MQLGSPHSPQGHVCTVHVYVLESFRSAYMLNVAVVNHVTPSAGNVHGKILMFYMSGTMFHHKCIPVGSFLVQRFLFQV